MSDFKPIEPFVSKYGTPRVTPPKGEHPRLFFTRAALPRIKRYLSHREHAAAYARYIEMLEAPLASSGDHFEFSEAELMKVRYRALAYPLLDREDAAREAIAAIFCTACTEWAESEFPGWETA